MKKEREREEEKNSKRIRNKKLPSNHNTTKQFWIRWQKKRPNSL